MESQLVRPDHEPRNVELQQAPQLGGGDDHHEKKSVLRKVKDKAKKLKTSLKLGGHNHNHTGEQEADEDDDDDDEETVQDPGIHGAPRYDESAAVKFTNLPAQAEVSPGQTGTGYRKSTPMVTGEDYPPAIAHDKQNPSKKSDLFLRETLGLQDTTDTSSKKSGPFLHETSGQKQQVKLEGLKENPFDPKADPSLPITNFNQKQEQSPGLTGTGYGKSTPMVTGDDEYSPVIAREKQNPPAETYIGATDSSSKKSDPFLQETPGQQQQEVLKENLFEPKAGPLPTGYEEAGVMPLLSSLEKMHIHDKDDKKQSSIPLSSNPPATTGSGSHDQFSAQSQQEEPMQLRNTEDDESLLDTGTPSTDKESSPQGNIKTEGHPAKQSTYLQKLSYVTSAITDKFSPRAKHEEPMKPRNTDDDESLLGTDTPSTEESSPKAIIKTDDASKQSTYLGKLSSATITAKNVVASKFGYGEKGDTTTDEQSPRELGDESKNNQGVTSVPRDLGDENKNNQGMASSAMDYGKSVTATAKNVVASKFGYGEKGNTTTDEQVPRGLGDESKNNQGVTSIARELGDEKKSNQGMISSAMDYGKGITVTAKNVVASKLGYGEKGDTTRDEQVQQVPRELGDENKNNQGMASSAVNYGKRVTATVTDKLTPMYHKVVGTGNVDESKSGGENKGVSVKDYLSEKLRPGDDDRALSEVITNAWGKKRDQTKAEGDEFYDVQGNEGDQGELKLQSSAQ